jgi:murein DD-endopeptidase MepM/ murein hydrolase activator NlpD
VEVARLPDVASDQTAYGDAGDYDTSASSGGYQMSDDGRAVIVRQGDSLYKIARDYNVSMSELMRANRMSSPSVRLGQRINLPSSRSKRTAKSLYKSKPVLESRAPANYSLAGDGETYRVQSGDSLYGIARRFNVRAEDIAEANGIDDPAKLRPGQVIRIPGGEGGASTAEAATSKSRKRVAAVRETATDDSGSGADTSYSDQDRGTDSESTAADDGSDDGQGSTDEFAARTTEEDSEPEARTDAQFRWPVKGRIVAKFGDSLDGARNDGINVAVPLGTDVKAAENGVVAYAGDELKGYGKLVLIRHADNWVSAYAHNDEIVVKRGDTVSRGQVISKAGKTGEVDQPQLHFELRKGSQPVDPLPHMSGG